MLQVSYVGSHGSNLIIATNLNQIPESKLGPNDISFRPYPQFQGIGGNKAAGISNYNALQVVIDKHLSHGLEFNANYTWSKMLDDQDSAGWGGNGGSEPFQNASDPSANYGPSNFDVRNMLKGQAIYQLPFGKGERFLNKGYGLDKVVGGWQLSGTIVDDSGNPFTPTMATNTTFSQAGVQYPNVVGNPNLPSRGINGWFNLTAFASPGPGKYGNMQRNFLYGPGLFEFNAALRKTFPIWKHVAFQINADAVNVINHPSFGLPDSLIGPNHSALIRSITVGGRTVQLVGRLTF